MHERAEGEQWYVSERATLVSVCERERERENESLCVRNKESHTGECVGEGENTGEWCERCDVLPQV